MRHFVQSTAAFALLIGACSVSTVTAYATTQGGLDTPTNVYDLPLAVQGTAGIDLSVPNGSPVGTVPNAVVSGNLSANGAISPGSSTNVTACGMGQANGEGSERYNYTTHALQYCNGTGWISTNNVPTEYCTSSVGSATYTAYASCPDGTLPLSLYCKLDGPGWSTEAPVGTMSAGKYAIVTYGNGLYGNEIDQAGTQITCTADGVTSVQACVRCL